MICLPSKTLLPSVCCQACRQRHLWGRAPREVVRLLSAFDPDTDSLEVGDVVVLDSHDDAIAVRETAGMYLAQVCNMLVVVMRCSLASKNC